MIARKSASTSFAASPTWRAMPLTSSKSSASTNDIVAVRRRSVAVGEGLLEVAATVS